MLRDQSCSWNASKRSRSASAVSFRKASTTTSANLRFIFRPFRWPSKCSFPIHLRLTKTACRRKMAKEQHDLPLLVVAKYPFGGRHPGGRNAVVDHPLQLAIRVSLNI